VHDIFRTPFPEFPGEAGRRGRLLIMAAAYNPSACVEDFQRQRRERRTAFARRTGAGKPPHARSDALAAGHATQRGLDRGTSRLQLAVAVASLLVCCAVTAGCVQRRLTIRSNPEGAVAYVDDVEIGTTPVSTDFIYYGTRKIRLVKDGYETLTVMQPVQAPWYQWVPIDFVAENLWPSEIRDERLLDFRMTPRMITPTEELRARAEELRNANRTASASPAAP
jgi:hypothetical protein